MLSCLSVWPCETTRKKQQETTATTKLNLTLTFHMDWKEAAQEDVAGQRDLVGKLADAIGGILVVIGAA